MRHAITGLIAAGAIAGAHAQTPSPPWVGTWELDVARSEYRAGAAPRRETLVISPNVGTYKITISRTDAGGGMTQSEAVATFDGADVLVVGPTCR